jgi:hypothetical protein
MKHKTPPRIELSPTPETDAAFALRHTKTCTIAHFRQVMEKMERERDAARQALKDAGKGKVPTEWDKESIHSQYVNKPVDVADPVVVVCVSEIPKLD